MRGNRSWLAIVVYVLIPDVDLAPLANVHIRHSL